MVFKLASVLGIVLATLVWPPASRAPSADSGVTGLVTSPGTPTYALAGARVAAFDRNVISVGDRR